MLKKSSLREDFKEFIAFLKNYLQKKMLAAGKKFEQLKSLLVGLLISKRGKYQQSFINTSFFLLVVSIWVAGPIIAENNPILGQNIVSSTNQSSSIISAYSFGTRSVLTTKISQKPRDKIVYYTVQSGDTLSAVAKKFDISVDTIKWANNLKGDIITSGEKIKIPPVTGIVYTVQSGDTVYSIAKKHNTEAQKIVNFPFNEFSDLDTFALTPGQILYVPDGSPPSLAPARPEAVPQYFAGTAGTGSFIWPATGYISQYAVWYHMALDIANPSSPPILAADSGTVSYANCVGWGYGCYITVDHANGYQTLYAHLSSYNVSLGQSVNKGQIIGVMGSTGRSTGTHLHFEIRQNGILLNPLDFLK